MNCYNRRDKKKENNMAKILALANQKGGVGKTTTCVNLCAALHSLGKQVLLVDCDPQGNASSGMGVSKSSRPNTYDMLIRAIPPEACVVHTPYGDVIPTGKELAAASVELIETEKREYVLKQALNKLYSEYDYICIDCPPSLELLTVNALVSAVTTRSPRSLRSPSRSWGPSPARARSSRRPARPAFRSAGRCPPRR